MAHPVQRPCFRRLSGEEHAIEGVCDVIMVGRAELEALYQQMRGLAHSGVDGKSGATVRCENVECTFRGERGSSGAGIPPSAFPHGTLFVLRAVIFTELLARLAAVEPATPSSPPSSNSEKLLGTRERFTLLAIIDALAEECGIDLRQPFKAAEVSVKIAERRGLSVSARAIAEHLKSIREGVGSIFRKTSQ